MAVNIQALVDAAKTQGGGIVSLPAGTYTVTDTINITDCQGVEIWGVSVKGTKIIWAGPSDRPLFNFDQTLDCALGDLQIVVQSGNTLLEAVRVQDSGTYGSQASSRLSVINVRVEGAAGATVGTGCRIYQAQENGGKNDHHYFERFVVQYYTLAGLVIEGQAAVNQVLVGCQFQARDIGLFGILTGIRSGVGDPREGVWTSIAGKGGTFKMFGGVVMEQQTAGFQCDGRNGTCIAVGVTMEQAAKLLVVVSAGGAYSCQVVIFDAIKFTNQGAVYTLGGGELVTAAAGGVIVRDCQFGLNAAAQDYTFNYNVAAAKRLCWVFDNNVVNTSRTSGWFTGLAPDSKAGSYAFDGATSRVM